jgi:hypothetical protein
VQIKLPAGATENVNGLAGTSFARQLQGIGHNDVVDVQVNVQTPDRVGVVSETVTVKRRPDLFITRVGAPPHAAKGIAYNITAVVREANGDTGARASCVLLADGAEVDRVNNMWVDAGGTVTCEMTHIFRAAGTVSLSVAVTDVAPGDYDAGNNNSAAVPVKVYDRVTDQDEWQASAHEETFYRRNWSRSPTAESETLVYGYGVGVNFWTLFRRGGVNIDTLRASVHASTDGRLLHQVDDVQFQYRTSYDDWEGETIRCAYAKYDDRYSGINACQYSSPWSSTRTQISYTLNAGSVTYISRGWYQIYVGGQPADTYYWNDHWPSEWGNRFDLGNTARVRVQFSDGNHYFDTDANMELLPYGHNDPWTESCSPDGSWCGGSADIYEGRDAITGNW